MIGYNTVEDQALSAAGTVYGHVLLWMVGSFLVVGAIVVALRVTATRAILRLAATAAGLYYWFGLRTIAETLQLGPVGVATLRIVFLSLVAVWLWRAVGLPLRRRTEP